LAAAGAAVVAFGVLGAGAPAIADTVAPHTVTTTAPMVSRGYDAKVAEANGFTIVTDADGTQRSVPVTDAAKAIVASAKPSGVHVLNTVSGDCGSSTVTAVYAGNAKVTVVSSYRVRLTAVEQQWHVNAVPASTGKVGHIYQLLRPEQQSKLDGKAADGGCRLLRQRRLRAGHPRLVRDPRRRGCLLLRRSHRSLVIVQTG
jgi:hypothetical protein